MELLTYKFGYVYKTTNLINQKIYIGQHKRNRFDPYYKGSGSRLWIAINKYGYENFSVEIIKWCSSLDELDQSEVFYIKYFNSINPLIGYNLTTAIYQRGKTSKGKYGNHNHLGKKLTEDQKHNLSVSHKGQVVHNIGKHVYNNGVNNIYLSEGGDIPEGYSKGRSPLGYTRKSPKNESKIKGKIYVNDGNKNYYIPLEELNDYLSNGYSRGFLRLGNRKIHIHKGDKRLLIDPDNLDDYLDLGYEIGQGFSSNKGRILLMKDGHRKYIYPEDIDKYRNLGYTLNGDPI